MAVVQMGAIAHSIVGKLEGSVFRVNTYGVTILSNNWSKRGRGARHFQNRFVNASLASQWRALTADEKNSWTNYDGIYLKKLAVTNKRRQLGSTKTYQH